MRKTIGLMLAAAVLIAGTASAQPLKPGTPSILRWTLEQQTEWYPAPRAVRRALGLHQCRSRGGEGLIGRGPCARTWP